MALSDKQIKQITTFVRTEPRTVQDVSKLIGKSWVTANSYIQKVKERTGLIDIKTFRKGTRGALKLVYFVNRDSPIEDDVKKHLFYDIKQGRNKTDFDFMELFQFVPGDKKRCFMEEYDEENVSHVQQIVSLFNQAESQIYCFSGTLSFVHIKEKDMPLIDVIEELLKRKVMFKILCRVNIASLTNISKLRPLMNKYPDLIEIKHCFQPLRGFIIDNKIARFKDEEQLKKYQKHELRRNTRIFYEIYDDDWIAWLQRLFWHTFRSSIDHSSRVREIQKIF
ncbi:MAG: hypothetical protein ACE5FT_04165 [Candidatus Nanoarchaeia archaeon]